MLYYNQKEEIKGDKKMKKIYKITVAMVDEVGEIILTNPPRRFLKVGYTEYSGARILKVERIK